MPHAFRCKDGLNEKFKAARPFSSVIILSSVIGIALDFADVSPMKALYRAAIVSGLLAPFLLIGILIVASDRKIMRQQPSCLLSRLTVALPALAMLGAAVGMFCLLVAIGSLTGSFSALFQKRSAPIGRVGWRG